MWETLRVDGVPMFNDDGSHMIIEHRHNWSNFNLRINSQRLEWETDDEDDPGTLYQTSLLGYIPAQLLLDMIDAITIENPHRNHNTETSVHRYIGEKWGNKIGLQFVIKSEYSYVKGNDGKYLDYVTFSLNSKDDTAIILFEIPYIFKKLKKLRTGR